MPGQCPGVGTGERAPKKVAKTRIYSEVLQSIFSYCIEVLRCLSNVLPMKSSPRDSPELLSIWISTKHAIFILGFACILIFFCPLLCFVPTHRNWDEMLLKWHETFCCYRWTMMMILNIFVKGWCCQRLLLIEGWYTYSQWSLR